MVKDIIQAIKEYETIIIHRHVRPDPDALGSQGGLMEIIKASFPSKKVYAVGEETPDLTFLLRMDKIEDSIYNGALVIVCDTANSPRIDDDRYTLGAKLIKIDHHPVVDKYGDIRWENTEASSVSEMIFELYLEGKEDGLQMNEKAARLLYAGIVGDTGRFLFPSSTKKTFQYAAELVTYSFDRTQLYQQLYSEKDNIARLKGYILQQFSLFPSGVCIIKLTKEILNKYGVSAQETGQLVHVISEIEGIKAWAFFIEEEDQIRVRIRSKGPIINGIAEKYNGGGHPLASGATIYDWNEVEKVQADLEEVCRNNG
ncbi:bifunctional oligoribonuclease/PAP phosphatase NrnA [Oceanobacillus piezotolerans]|uniref:Bifunctional oligoribonuclease/PAP phosphatase NrnA n=1 Tax=Oceanobacillus piezotolerans TaxID=2448030 RepID=A0A498DEC4_9BACI|nr:bifunctional oligoribonuclease/PAP phosphatase NrnA [Oceanobacillus piezotolerans]RLL47875.1 bifunctional oligoribonuclease/PAP phosphatase NrnA [Oceanobacillus piezotolerans]